MNARSEWRHRRTAAESFGELDMLELRWLDELESHERRRRRAMPLSDLTTRFRALPVLDDRSPDEIIGYDGTGLAR